MTPLEISMLIHWYSQVSDPDLIFSAQKVAVDRFLAANLIEKTEPGSERFFDLTGRGKAYVQSLRRVPLPEPVEIWVTEWPDK